MHIESVPNRNSRPAILLRESCREGGKVKKRTLAILSRWPEHLVEGLRTLLRGGVAVAKAEEALSIKRSLPHGHVAAILGIARTVGLPALLTERSGGAAGRRCRDLVLAMLVDRLIAPSSKLATVRALNPGTAASSLGEVLGLGVVQEREVYAALDWLLEQQERIERALAGRQLGERTLVLYDVSSSYLEGRKCELAQFGHTATTARTSRRSSTACCATATAARSPSRCSTARPPIRARWPTRWPRSNNTSLSSESSSSATVA